MYKLTIILFLISGNLFCQFDSLLLIKKSRIKFCLQQNVKLNILTERLLVKDSIIVLTNNRLDVKDSIIESFKRDSENYVKIVENLKTENSLKDSDITIYKKELRISNFRLIRTKVLSIVIVSGIAILALVAY